MRWEIFCEVIDNHGDLGVSLRLARDLAARGETVRLWVDDASALTWMAPDLASSRASHGLQVLDWPRSTEASVLHALREAPADVLIETFGCNPPAAFIDAWSQGHASRGTPRGVWINLEYLSAEGFVERQHGLESPVSRTPSVRKFFYHPGFTTATGGLLREPSLLSVQPRWQRAALRRQWGALDDEWLVSLFCYEPAALPSLLARLATRAAAPAPDRPVRLLITPGRAAAAVDHALKTLDRTQPQWNHAGRLRLQHLPWLTQGGYDQLLWACDCNYVRGEDSLVRALWAGRPWIWQLYEQSGDAHHAKLQALLRWAEAAAGPAPASWRALMLQWNGLPSHSAAIDAMPDIASMAGWEPWAMRLRGHLLAQPDLTSALIGFVLQKR